MAEILFYHLTETPLQDQLPVLLEKSLARNWRACVHVGSVEHRDKLNEYLWTFSQNSFLPHGVDEEPHASEQPILLTTSEQSANNAQIRFVVEMGPTPNTDECERIVFMFDGHDQDQLEQARHQWKSYASEGVEKTYWQQTPERRWVKKA